MITCACGCGGEIPERDRKGRPRRFVLGHQSGFAVVLVKIGATSKFTGYARSKKLIPVTEACTLAHIGGCGGPLQRAHLDGNPLNNVSTNVRVFCNSHHFLYDRGRIDLSNPVMPEFFISGGSRRYRPRLKPRICKLPSCAKPFTSESAPNRYCSPECSSSAKRETHRLANLRYVAKRDGFTWEAPCR